MLLKDSSGERFREPMQPTRSRFFTTPLPTTLPCGGILGSGADAKDPGHGFQTTTGPRKRRAGRFFCRASPFIPRNATGTVRLVAFGHGHV